MVTTWPGCGKVFSSPGKLAKFSASSALTSPTRQTHGEVGRHLRSPVGDQLDSLCWKVVLQGEPDTAGVVVVRAGALPLPQLEGAQQAGDAGEGEQGREEGEGEISLWDGWAGGHLVIVSQLSTVLQSSPSDFLILEKYDISLKGH